jgi:hypothetical protein
MNFRERCLQLDWENRQAAMLPRVFRKLLLVTCNSVVTYVFPSARANFFQAYKSRTSIQPRCNPLSSFGRTISAKDTVANRRTSLANRKHSSSKVRKRVPDPFLAPLSLPVHEQSVMRGEKLWSFLLSELLMLSAKPALSKKCSGP